MKRFILNSSQKNPTITNTIQSVLWLLSCWNGETLFLRYRILSLQYQIYPQMSFNSTWLDSTQLNRDYNVLIKRVSLHFIYKCDYSNHVNKTMSTLDTRSTLFSFLLLTRYFRIKWVSIILYGEKKILVPSDYDAMKMIIIATRSKWDHIQYAFIATTVNHLDSNAFIRWKLTVTCMI